jgi:L-ascorbate metabolism protein UlaG (beta-lactamase superfamily)
MDWGGVHEMDGVAVHCVPAVHFSGRGLFDRNRTLWCGFLLQSSGESVYFAGDTGFGDHFAAIRQQFGPPDVALLPIGAYRPRWFMKPVHMSPEDAIEAHRILEARRSVAIHHGTFQMADDALDAAREELMRAEAPESFVLLNNGESVGLL